MAISVEHALNMGLIPLKRPNSRGYLLKAKYPRRILTIPEAARLVSVDPTTLRDAIKQRRLYGRGNHVTLSALCTWWIYNYRHGMRPSRTGRKWQPWEDVIVGLYSISEAARRLSRSYDSVKVRRCRLRKSKWRKNED